jgi:hypothetical protein
VRAAVFAIAVATSSVNAAAARNGAAGPFA